MNKVNKTSLIIFITLVSIFTVQAKEVVIEEKVQPVISEQEYNRLKMALFSGKNIEPLLSQILSKLGGEKQKEVFLKTLQQAFVENKSLQQALSSVKKALHSNAKINKNIQLPLSPNDELLLTLVNNNSIDNALTKLNSGFDTKQVNIFKNKLITELGQGESTDNSVSIATKNVAVIISTNDAITKKTPLLSENMLVALAKGNSLEPIWKKIVKDHNIPPFAVDKFKKNFLKGLANSYPISQALSQAQKSIGTNQNVSSNFLEALATGKDISSMINKETQLLTNKHLGIEASLNTLLAQGVNPSIVINQAINNTLKENQTVATVNSITNTPEAALLNSLASGNNITQAITDIVQSDGVTAANPQNLVSSIALGSTISNALVESKMTANKRANTLASLKTKNSPEPLIIALASGNNLDKAIGTNTSFKKTVISNLSEGDSLATAVNKSTKQANKIASTSVKIKQPESDSKLITALATGKKVEESLNQLNSKTTSSSTEVNLAFQETIVDSLSEGNSLAIALNQTDTTENATTTASTQETVDSSTTENATTTASTQETVDSSTTENAITTASTQETTDSSTTENATTTALTQETTDSSTTENAITTASTQETTDSSTTENATTTASTQETTDSSTTENATTTSGQTILVDNNSTKAELTVAEKFQFDVNTALFLESNSHLNPGENLASQQENINSLAMNIMQFTNNVTNDTKIILANNEAIITNLATPFDPVVIPEVVIDPTLTPEVVVDPTLTPVVVVDPTLTPVVVVDPSLTPEVVVDPTLTPVVVVDPTLTPEVVVDPTLSPEVVVDPTLSPEVVVDPTLTPEVVVDPTLTPEVVVDPTLTPEVVVDPTLTPEVVVDPTLTPDPDLVTRLIAWKGKTHVLLNQSIESAVISTTIDTKTLDNVAIENGVNNKFNLNSQLSESLAETGNFNHLDAGRFSSTYQLDDSSLGSFKYTGWGQWEVINGNIFTDKNGNTVEIASSYWVIGESTGLNMPKTGSANYTGAAIGDFRSTDGDIEIGAIQGSVNFQADFAKQTLSGGMLLSKNGQAFASPTILVPASFTSEFHTPFGNNGFVNGLFYGPNAEEVGGVWVTDADDGTGSGEGIYRAKTTSTAPIVRSAKNFTLPTDSSNNDPLIIDTERSVNSLNTEQQGHLENFSYTTWGDWDSKSVNTANSQENTSKHNYWVEGDKTVDLPKTGSAIYTGIATGDFTSTANSITDIGAINGIINLQVNFSNQTVSGDMQLNKNGAAWDAISMNPANIVESGWNGTLTGNSSSGAVQGNFYGPNAEEAGGVWDLANDKGKAAGAFKAKK